MSILNKRFIGLIYIIISYKIMHLKCCDDFKNGTKSTIKSQSLNNDESIYSDEALIAIIIVSIAFAVCLGIFTILCGIYMYYKLRNELKHKLSNKLKHMIKETNNSGLQTELPNLQINIDVQDKQGLYTNLNANDIIE